MSRFDPIFRRGLFIVYACVCIAGTPVTGSVAETCDRAAEQAARDTGVPLSVLRAITRTETGRTRRDQLEPWPWTVNMEGVGKWFETEDAARAYVFQHFKRGARSFDVGCFQINYKWHGQAFKSIEDMFDPTINALYAAQFLSNLHTELGSWSKAAGAYHSRTKEYADRYVARFEKIHAALGSPRTVSASRPESPERTLTTNGFPLLVQTDTAGQLGSLVPLRRNSGAQPLASLRRGG